MKTTEILRHIMAVNFSTRNPNAVKLLSHVAYAKECKTIELNIGRRAGHTTVMLELARPNDLIITHNYDTAYGLQRDNQHCLKFTYASQYDIPSWMMRKQVDGLGWIWIDEPSACEKYCPNLMDLLYNFYPSELYIKLGA